jgi:ubiquinone/menaquinone biosynthesis C-methylase UbiE
MTQSVSFDRAADYYDATRGFPPGVEHEVAQAFVRAGALSSSHRVFEIGVGTGRIALPLSPHVGEYVGVDISTAMMDKLRARMDGHPIRLMQADAAHLPLASGTFDAAVAVHVFHLVGDAAAALREVARALRPGARLLHGWNSEFEADTLRQLFNRAAGVDERPAYHSRGVLPAHGWTADGEEVRIIYTSERTARQFLDALHNRIWSSCWTLSDAQLAVGLEAVNAHIAAEQIDLDQPIIRHGGFTVQAYAPPA